MKAKLGRLRRNIQNEEDISTRELSTRMMATADNNSEKEMWRNQTNQACEQQQRILDTKEAWEPMMQAAAGRIRAEEVISTWQQNPACDRQLAAQQWKSVIPHMTSKTAIEVPRIQKAIKI